LEDEVGDDNNGVGTHSNRKHSANKADKCGADTHQIEFRGRWVGDKGQKIVHKCYISPESPYNDDFVASMLCDGGALRCRLHEGLDVSDAWLFTNVIPNVKERFGRDIRFCRVMALARLWSVFDEDASQLLPETDVARIRNSFQGDCEGNPVKKVSLEIMKVGGRLQIVDVSREVQEQQQQHGNAAQMLRGADNTQLLAYIQRMEGSFNQQLQAIRSEQMSFRQHFTERTNLLIANQTRFGGTVQQSMSRGDPRMQQRRRQHEGARQQQQAEARVNPPAAPFLTRHVDRYARLQKRLSSLHDYWEEYQFGIGDNKAAKSFSMAERNSRQYKQTYCRRSKVWKLQCYLINAGFSIAEANHRICDVYNSTKPTAIMLQITRDQKNQSYNFVGSQRIHPRLYVNQS